MSLFLEALYGKTCLATFDNGPRCVKTSRVARFCLWTIRLELAKWFCELPTHRVACQSDGRCVCAYLNSEEGGGLTMQVEGMSMRDEPYHSGDESAVLDIGAWQSARYPIRA
eukprot:5985822-Amphidinium_carterae.1